MNTRSRKACLSCRALKTRCLPCKPEDPPTAPCLRCVRLDIECEYRSARRGPPKGYKRGSRQPHSSIPRTVSSRGGNPSPPTGHERDGARDDWLGSGRGDGGRMSGVIADHHDNGAGSSSLVVPSWQQQHQQNHNQQHQHQDHPLAGPGTGGAASEGSRNGGSLKSPPVSYAKLRPSSFILPIPQPIRPDTANTFAADSLTRLVSRDVEPVNPETATAAAAAAVAGSRDANVQSSGLPTFETYLEPHIGGEDSRQGTPEGGVGDTNGPFGMLGRGVSSLGAAVMVLPDPISVGLLSEPEARMLFKQFVDHVSPSSHLFDHQYTTYDYAVQHPALFSAIMYATTRFFRPIIADTCLDLAETCISRITRSGTVELSFVQALLVLVYWKRPTDQTAYFKLGLAARCVCQLGFKWKIHHSSWASIEEEREQVAIERTMYNAFSMDNSWSMLLRLPMMGWACPSGADMFAWAEQHAHLNVPGDMFKASLQEFWELHIELKKPATAVEHTDSLTEQQQRQNRTIDLLEQLTDRWLNNPDLVGVYRSITTLMFKGLLMRHYTNGIPERHDNLMRVMALLDELGILVSHLCTSGEVVFFADVTSFLLSTPALSAYRARQYMDAAEVKLTMTYLHNATAALDGLSGMLTDDHGLHYVRRTYHRILKGLNKYEAGQEDAADMLANLELFKVSLSNEPMMTGASMDFFWQPYVLSMG